MTLPIDIVPRVMRVIDYLREGKTLKSACDLAGVSRPAVLAYVRKDEDLSKLFDAALEEADDTLAEILIDIDQVHSDAKMAAVVSKNIQWFLARRRPNKFGDRMIVSNEGSSADRTLVEALREALKRIPLPPAAQMTAFELASGTATRLVSHNEKDGIVIDAVPLTDEELSVQ